MKYYIEIKNGKVNPIKISPDKVIELQAANLTIIDATEITPRPQAGWAYDGKFFTEPIIKEKVIITCEELWDRFTTIEQDSLIGASDKNFKNFLYTLGIHSRIDLSKQSVIDILDALEAAGIISTGRAKKIGVK